MYNPLPTETLISFVNDFKRKNESLENLRIQSDKAIFSSFLNGFLGIKNTIDLYEKKLTSDYNIFYILRNMYKDEERTHTPLLADLLNPDGRHKQGKLFLESFIKDIETQIEIKIPFSKDSMVLVEKEMFTNYGRIDIVITIYDKNKTFAIAIENKIYAQDQNEQIERYSSYLESAFRGNYLLIYLPVRERNPDENSISTKRRVELISKNKLMLMSYEKNIMNLINNTIPQVESPTVKSLLNQYLQTIKQL